MIIFFFLLSLLITKLLNPTFYASIINLSLNKFFSLRTFEISSKFSLSLSFFSLKGISRSRETCNVKYKNHEMGEKGGKFPGIDLEIRTIIEHHRDNFCRVLDGKRDIFTESTIIIQLHVLPRRCPVIRSTGRTSSWRISSTSNRRHPSMTFRIVP